MHKQKKRDFLMNMAGIVIMLGNLGRGWEASQSYKANVKVKVHKRLKLVEGD